MNAGGAGDAAYEERMRKFIEFLDNTDDHTDYKAEIRHMLDKNRTRLVVSLDELREFDRDLWKGVLDTPSEFLPAMTDGLKEVATAMQNPAQHSIDESTLFFLGFRGTFGSHLVNPRTIDAAFLGKTVCIEGIVTRCTIVRPKISRSVHYNESDAAFTYKDYRDAATSFDPMPSTSAYPTDDGNGHRLIMEYGLSKYRDHQTISLQEMPEKAPAGQLPRNLDIIMDDDLVDKCKPGDRVHLVGIYRSLGSGAQQKSTFRNLMVGLNVELLGSKGDGQISQIPLTDTDIRNINVISRRPDLFDLLSRSLAPSIYGFEWIKKAVLLMLLGGTEKNLANGTHIRGDINILMVGDPSTAKSQMLRFVLNTAPLAVATTGRGSTGVGLTAAVVTDQDTGERRLTAGAMVMADRGVVCIDEFDKMNEVDRVAIHEVMEQQTVTVAKAGIHTSLNARCSVVAAANPIYGRYDPHQDPAKNIALPDSLLSRFDLLFVVTDDVVDTQDRKISEHVLRMHQYVPEGSVEGVPQRETQFSSLNVGQEPGEDTEEVPIFEKYSEALHSGIQVTDEGVPDILTIKFMKRYIHYCKQRIRPVLSADAGEIITETYANLRSENLDDGRRRTTPITARTLETLIRLATAHAKLRLSQVVQQEDAEAAERILRFALFRTVLRASRHSKKPRRDVGDLGSDESDSEPEAGELTDEDDDDGVIPQYTDDDEDDGMEDDMDDEIGEEVNPPVPRTRAQRAHSRRLGSFGGDNTSTNLSADRLRRFRGIAARLIPSDDSIHFESITVSELIARVNNTLDGENQYTGPEAQAALDDMRGEGVISIEDGKIYRI